VSRREFIRRGALGEPSPTEYKERGSRLGEKTTLQHRMAQSLWEGTKQHSLRRTIVGGDHYGGVI